MEALTLGPVITIRWPNCNMLLCIVRPMCSGHLVASQLLPRLPATTMRDQAGSVFAAFCPCFAHPSALYTCQKTTSLTSCNYLLRVKSAQRPADGLTFLRSSRGRHTILSLVQRSWNTAAMRSTSSARCSSTHILIQPTQRSTEKLPFQTDDIPTR